MTERRDRKKLTRALVLGAAVGTVPLQLVGCAPPPPSAKDPDISTRSIQQTDPSDIGDRKALFLQAASTSDPRIVEKFLSTYPDDPSIPDLLTALPPRTLTRITPAAFTKVPPPILVQIPRPVAAQLRLPALQQAIPQPQQPQQQQPPPGFNPVFQATY